MTPVDLSRDTDRLRQKQERGEAEDPKEGIVGVGPKDNEHRLASIVTSGTIPWPLSEVSTHYHSWLSSSSGSVAKPEE